MRAFKQPWCSPEKSAKFYHTKKNSFWKDVDLNHRRQSWNKKIKNKETHFVPGRRDSVQRPNSDPSLFALVS